MTTDRAGLSDKAEPAVPVQLKLAAAWASLMFLSIYVDYLHLYTPGAVAEILAGKVWRFDISQTFATSALASMAIPAFMVMLSAALPARVNRIVNLVVGCLLIPYYAFNLADATWVYFYGLGLALELIIFVFILRTAWTWRPRRRW